MGCVPRGLRVVGLGHCGGLGKFPLWEGGLRSRFAAQEDLPDKEPAYGPGATCGKGVLLMAYCVPVQVRGKRMAGLGFARCAVGCV